MSEAKREMVLKFSAEHLASLLSLGRDMYRDRMRYHLGRDDFCIPESQISGLNHSLEREITLLLGAPNVGAPLFTEDDVMNNMDTRIFFMFLVVRSVLRSYWLKQYC